MDTTITLSDGTVMVGKMEGDMFLPNNRDVLWIPNIGYADGLRITNQKNNAKNASYF